MNPESLVFFNLQIYLLGFIFFLSLNNTVFVKTTGAISLVISTLGVIVTSSLLVNNPGTVILTYDWLPVGDEPVHFILLINAQTRFMLFLVQVIACFVNLFSMKYMSDDPGVNRFFAYLNLFVFSMLGLVLAGNLLQLYFFWELVGFCSYLLIGFWYAKKTANAAAIKAFLVNRIGDAFFLAGIFLLYYLYGTFRFDDYAHLSVIERNYIYLDAGQLQTLAVGLLFGGVMAKSAQLPLQVWLPDAMEGPTPASALIHAATMVVAGVFLLGRISPLITADAGLFISITGALTSVIAGFSALYQYDLKKVLAFSTVSQLGFMVAGMGMGEMASSLFHLTTHAFFKAGLFLCAGAIISYLHHEQDMRKMGDLIRKMPTVFAAFLICSGALIGLPLSGGYLSKESILNAAWIYGLRSADYKLVVPVLLTLASFLTTCYVVRMVVMVFFQREDSPVEIILDTTKKTVDGALKSIKGLLTADNKGSGEDRIIQFIRNLGVFDTVTLGLAFCSLWFFYSSNPLHPEDTWFFREFGGIHEMYDWLPWLVGFLILSALLISYNSTLEEIRRYYFKQPEGRWQRWFSRLALRQFYMDNLYERLYRKVFTGRWSILKPVSYIETAWIDAAVVKLGKSSLYLAKMAGTLEKEVVDASVMGFFAGIKSLGNKIRKWGNGNIQLYLTGLIIALAAMVFILIIL
ncbi:MAG: NADH-quinone oxidoreductase subunit L [Leadbetterella sp.]|nr:NADH-quinone oxidoreductase subunit L [Leadbetterella sp.]